MVLSSTKASHERHHEETHTHTLLSFVFSLHLFNGALVGSESPSPPLSTPFTNAIHDSVHAKEWIVGECLWCVFLLSSQFRLSAVSVVFDFSDSLNDDAPLSPILLSDDVKKNRRVNC